MNPRLAFFTAVLEVCLTVLVMMGWECVQVILSIFMDPLPGFVYYGLFLTALLVSIGIDINQIYSANYLDGARSLPSYLVRFGTNCFVYFIVLTPLAIRYGLNSNTFTAKQMKEFMTGEGTGDQIRERVFLDTMSIAIGRVAVTGIEVGIAFVASFF